MSIYETLGFYNVGSVWHFTDASNLETIAKYGILSLNKIVNQNIEVACFGADSLSHSLDKSRGLDHFVHVSFIRDHPMYHKAKKRGSIKNPIWLELKLSILDDNMVLVSNEVANKNNSKIYQLNRINNLGEIIDFPNMIHPQDFWTGVEAKKAELMIPNEIKIENIIGVHRGY
jgi:hypothetical protein